MTISSILRNTREYESEAGEKVTAEERPVYHFSPLIGWLNDPNGLSYYDGKYHMFYQYHPYSTYWGPMHWGHAVSSDMIRWEYLPCAMAPDRDYDGAGCFSGSAAILPDGRLLLMYTGCSNDDPDPDGRWKQTQCIAVSSEGADGSTEFIKYEGNPVITGEDFPPGGDPYEFRDPFIWQASDGSYRAVISNANNAGNRASRICLYRSSDGFSWKFDKVLFEDSQHLGIMWECPDFFPLDGRHILMASPMNMDEEESDGSVRFPKGNNVCYIVGDYNDENETFSALTGGHQADGIQGPAAAYYPVDCGLDFYAPQILFTPDGRCVMIGWMQDPSMSNKHSEDQFRIFGQMTVPRELSLRNDRLIQRPVRELEAYRESRVCFSGLRLDNEERSLPGISGRIADIEICLQAGDMSSFAMRFACSGDVCTEIRFDPDRSLLCIDRSRSGQSCDITGSRSIRIRDRGGRLDMRILLDRWSAEVFVNGGEQVMSATFYTPLDAEGISFSVEGSAVIDVTKYSISEDGQKNQN